MSDVATLVPRAPAGRPRAPRVARPRPGASRFVAVSAGLHVAAVVALRALFPASLGIPERPAIVESVLQVETDLAPDPVVEPPRLPPPDRPPDECPPLEDEPPLVADWTPAEDMERGAISITTSYGAAPHVRLRSGPPRAASGDGPPGAAPGPPEPMAAVEAPPREPVIESARALTTRAPEYPESARASGTEGVVRLVVEVLEDGTVGDVEVVESSGSRALDDAAIAALRRWTFAPARIDGVPHRSRVRIRPIRFRIEGRT